MLTDVPQFHFLAGFRVTMIRRRETKMYRIPLLLLLLLLIFAGCSGLNAQSRKSIRGYLCKHTDDSQIYGVNNQFGRFGIRASNRIEFFNVKVWGIPMDFTGYLQSDRLGTEYLIRYIIENGQQRAVSVKRTGRFRRTAPCSE
jgi:hypothetical protein